MKTYCLLFFGCLLLTVSCKNGHGTLPTPWDNDTIISIHFLKEIPVTKKGSRAGQTDLIYIFTHYDISRLRLYTIENGYNALQLRVWLGNSLAISKHAVSITRQKKQWHARIISYTSGIYKDAIKENREAEPSDGWDAFAKKIVDLKILDLSNSDDLSGYKGCGADGIDYRFEIATAKKYRFYDYCNPDLNTAKFWQAKNVLEFAALLEKEFGFTYTK